MPDSKPADPTRHDLGQLFTDLVRLQVKLLIDAARDVVLVPTALIAAGLDLLLRRWQRPVLFYRVLQLGERSERLIDLWSVLYARAGPPPARVDAVLNDVEAAMRDPAYGKHRARVLKRWLARRWRHETARLAERAPGLGPAASDSAEQQPDENKP